jgi:hypothetical protein
MLNIVANNSTQTIVEIVRREITSGLLDALAQNHTGGDTAIISIYEASQAEEDRINNGDEYLLIWNVDGITIDGLDFSPEDDKPYMRFEVSRATVKADAPADLALSGIGVWEAGTYNQGDYTYRNNNIWQCTATSTTETPTTSASDWAKICSALQLTLTALQSDNSTVVTGFNDTVLIPVTDNEGRTIPLLCPFDSGVCNIVLAFKSVAVCGSWSFPDSSNEVDAVDAADQSVTTINVDGQITVDVILPF